MAAIAHSPPESPPSRTRLADYALATAIMVVTSLVALAIGQVLAAQNVLLVFFIGVLAAAVRTSTGPALWSAVFGFLAYNFFFTEPHHSFEIMHREDLLTVVFFLLLSGVTGHQATRLRRHILAQQASNCHIQDLLALSRSLSAAPDGDAVAATAAAFLNNRLGVPAVLARGEPPTHWHCAASPADLVLTESEAATARASWRAGMPEQGGRFRFYPLGEGACAALLALGCDRPHPAQLLDGARQQIGQALKRTQLVRDLEAAKLSQETEQLRSALLASVSHDLKTPLAAMIGATSSIIQYEERLSPEERRELLETTLQEAERLHRYIQNLLDMVKLDGGRLSLERDWVTPSDLVNAAVGRLEPSLAELRVQLAIPPSLPLLYVHSELVEQALINVLENAARYAPAGDTIHVRAHATATELVLDTLDTGPGIAPEERSRVFDMFYSVAKGDRQQGSGLGLAICKGVVTAHGGSVEALAGVDGRGTCLRMRLPLHEQPDLPDDCEREAP